MSVRHSKKKKSKLEHFGEKMLEFDQKPVPKWANILAEIFIGWIPLVALIAVGVVMYLMHNSPAIPIGILLLIALLTWWAGREAQISRPIDRLRLPAMGVMLLISFLMSGSLESSKAKTGKKRKSR